MKFKSQVYTAVSGSVGGLTYSHNKGGMYSRGRATPTNPNTARQQNARNALATLSSYWTNGLSDATRDAWNLYAANVLVPNAFGDPMQISGVNHFVRANSPRLNSVSQLGLAAANGLVAQAPTLFDLPTFELPSSVQVLDTGETIINFDDTAGWTSQDNNNILVYMGRPRNNSGAFFKGPYRLQGAIEGDSVTPPSSPFTIAAGNQPWALSLGQRITMVFQLTMANEITSTPQTPRGLSSRQFVEVVVTT